MAEAASALQVEGPDIGARSFGIAGDVVAGAPAADGVGLGADAAGDAAFAAQGLMRMSASEPTSEQRPPIPYFSIGTASVALSNKLESGTYSEVWEGTVVSCDVLPAGFPIAVKVMHQLPRESQVAMYIRVRREVDMMTALNQVSGEGFVKILGHSFARTATDPEGVVSGLIAMQKANFDMFTFLERGGAHAVSLDVVRFTDQFLTAVSAAHEAGYAHRDLKLENVLLACNTGSPCDILITDLATACFFGRGPAPHKCKGEQFGKADAVGTPHYWPPEVWVAGEFAWQFSPSGMDVWAAGLVLCEVYLGSPCLPPVDDGMMMSALADLLLKNQRVMHMVKSLQDHIAELLVKIHRSFGDSWVFHLLSRMLDPDPTQRCSLSDCKRFFHQRVGHQAPAAKPVALEQLQGAQPALVQAG